jgi:hypothetical protein
MASAATASTAATTTSSSTTGATYDETCGDNDGKYVPRVVFFDLEPGVIDAVRTSPLG